MALVTIPRRKPLLQKLVNSIPVLGPAIDAIVSRRKSRRNRTRAKLALVPSIQTSRVIQSSRRLARRRKGGPTRANRLARRDGSLSMNPVPVSVGMGFSGNTFSFNGSADRVADYDSDKSLKIRGAGVINAPAVFTTNVGAQALWGVGGQLNIGAKELDTRLQAIASAFTFYAIRKVRFTYVPSLSAGGSGAVGNSASQQLAFGVDEDIDYSFNPTGFVTSNFPQVMDCSPSMATQSCAPQSMIYEHRGTRLYLVSQTGEADQLESIQFNLVGCSQFASTAASQIYGSMYAEYEIDFYSPSFIRTVVSQTSDAKDSKDSKAKTDVAPAVAVASSSIVKTEEPVSPTPSELVDLRLLKRKRDRYFSDIPVHKLMESKSDSKLPPQSG